MHKLLDLCKKKKKERKKEMKSESILSKVLVLKAEFLHCALPIVVKYVAEGLEEWARYIFRRK